MEIYAVMVFLNTDTKEQRLDETRRIVEGLKIATGENPKLIYTVEKTVLALAQGDGEKISKAIVEAKSLATPFILLPISEGYIAAGLMDVQNWLGPRFRNPKRP